MKHENKDVCSRCEKMIESLHPKLREAFLAARKDFPSLHTSSTWRGEEEQNRLYAEGLTLLKWPKSKHNALDEDKKPWALAMDLFRLTDEGKAEFRLGYYIQVANWFEEEGYPIIWGGDFKRFVDPPHFELDENAVSLRSSA